MDAPTRRGAAGLCKIPAVATVAMLSKYCALLRLRTQSRIDSPLRVGRHSADASNVVKAFCSTTLSDSGKIA